MSSERMALLLGELRRELHGAVVESMCYYGDKYGLNYGVSLHTIRKIAKGEGVDHKLATLLYRQDVRELKLAALWIAEPQRVEQERDFWVGGILNSEMAEEAAFALLHRCSWIGELFTKGELVSYSAALALASRCEQGDWRKEILPCWGSVVESLSRNEKLLPKGVVPIFDRVINGGATKDDLSGLLSQLPENRGADYIREEVAWRLELCEE
ncbi:MAG: DNA alkylation repair enzyme [Rikenellaceae bacterium]